MRTRCAMSRCVRIVQKSIVRTEGELYSFTDSCFVRLFWFNFVRRQGVDVLWVECGTCG